MMILQYVTLTDQQRRVIATAQVVERNGIFTGQIDLKSMPVSLKRLFKEYEEIVNSQVFSLLDEIEEKIESLHLKAEFEDGYEVALIDIQIYPTARKISFQVAKDFAFRPDGI